MPKFYFQKLGAGVAEMAQRRMEHAIRMGWSFNRYQQSVIGTPLSYRRAEMLEDWHKLYGIARAKTPQARRRAELFVERVVEPMAERYKTTTSKVIRTLREAEKKISALQPLAEEEKEFYKILEEESPRIRRASVGRR